MHIFYEELFDRLHELHAEVEKALDELPSEALDWQPGADMNPLGVLVTHLAGAERFWIGDVARGDPSDRDREAEFRVKGLNAAALKYRVRELEAYERSAFESMTLLDLEAYRRSPRDGRDFTIAWALAHALEHTAVHVGHIQLLVQLWKQKVPDVRIALEDSNTASARLMLDALWDEIQRRYEFTAPNAIQPDAFTGPGAGFWIAFSGEVPVGSIALMPLSEGVSELDAMYVAPEFRRTGLAQRLLGEVEAHARQNGFTAIRLRAGAPQPEAVRFYEKMGFYRIPRFGRWKDDETAWCFEKKL
jgi:GNAT superfamily N-acetyltransferase